MEHELDDSRGGAKAHLKAHLADAAGFEAIILSRAACVATIPAGDDVCEHPDRAGLDEVGLDRPPVLVVGGDAGVSEVVAGTVRLGLSHLRDGARNAVPGGSVWPSAS